MKTQDNQKKRPKRIKTKRGDWVRICYSADSIFPCAISKTIYKVRKVCYFPHGPMIETIYGYSKSWIRVNKAKIFIYPNFTSPRY